ncbi:hypothetical protein BRC66_07395 [Halobacteriales archaeon QH_2_66_30]|nr:MAG: hypothetical protein BRC66_07395 [Halobacteriales archaeon QH_2_66_30]
MSLRRATYALHNPASSGWCGLDNAAAVHAKQNSEHPAFLWAVVVFLAPLLGLVLYFLVGRNRRYSRPPGSGSRKSPSRRRPPR